MIQAIGAKTGQATQPRIAKIRISTPRCGRPCVTGGSRERGFQRLIRKRIRGGLQRRGATQLRENVAGRTPVRRPIHSAATPPAGTRPSATH